MASFWQIAAGVFLAVVLGVVLNKQNKDLSMLLTLIVCAMVLWVAASYLQPVLDFAENLQELGQLDSEILRILWKAVGITLIAEIATLVCQDAGTGALGRAVQLLAAAAVLWLSLPLMESLLETVQKIVGEI